MLTQNFNSFIENRCNEEIQAILHAKQIYAGDAEYDHLYDRLYHEFIQDHERDWKYEYAQYCLFMNRIFRETNYRY